MNPVEKLLQAGISRQKISEQTKISEPEISMLLRGKRKASLRHRRAFYQAFGTDPFEWDKK
jgi:transcriptional regulator with XRE-family HTH domain